MTNRVKTYREDFPMLKKTMHGKPLIYLDSAATAQKPQVVIDAMSDFYQNHYGTVHRAVYELAEHSTAEFQRTRTKVRTLLNAPSEKEIVFTKGTTESINLVARSFGSAFIQNGDEVIISATEHHANIVPWQMICQEKGAHLRVAPVDERGVLELDAFQEMLNPKVKLVAIQHVSNALGTIHPIKKIAGWAHQCGAKILVDGAQAAPHLPVDVQDLGVDFYAFSGHKFYGPTGVGVLYGREELLDAMPPYQGGGDMIQTVTFEQTSYNQLPLKFEAGTPPIGEVIGLGAAIDYIQKIGLTEIHSYCQELLNYGTEKLKEIPGLRIYGTAPEKTSIISFTVDGIHPLDLATMLSFKGIAVRSGHQCAQPTLQLFNQPALLRASFAFYNTEEEIDLFVDILKSVLKSTFLA